MSAVNLKMIYSFLRKHLEAIIWVTAIVLLAMTNPVDQCYSLCLFHHLGFDWCPGCGLGHAISWLFRGDVLASFNAHPLGIPAVCIIVFRVVTIIRKNYQQNIYSFKKSIQHG
jgi:hypothetical protein